MILLELLYWTVFFTGAVIAAGFNGFTLSAFIQMRVEMSDRVALLRSLIGGAMVAVLVVLWGFHP